MPAKWKIKEVEELTKKLDSSPVVAVAKIKGLPSKQMQQIRNKLFGQAEIRVSKNRLIKRAFDKSKTQGLKELSEKVSGPSALIFSDSNPFKLYQMFVSNRVKAPAKAGDIAPEDIVVPAGDTPFKPGPIIGDLQQVGIKAKIQGPIIAVVEDSKVIKAGEEFSAKLANVLTQLDILPMEIGVDIQVALEDGMVYDSDILDIDRDKTIADLMAGHQNALNLSVEAGIYNDKSVPLMIMKAASGARNLAIEAEIYNKETVDYFLAKADSQARGLAASASYEPGSPAKPSEETEEVSEAPKEDAKESSIEEASAEHAESEPSSEGQTLEGEATEEQSNSEEKDSSQ